MKVRILGLTRKDFGTSRGGRIAYWRVASFTTKAEAESLKKIVIRTGDRARISPSIEVINDKYTKIYAVYSRTID